MAKAGIGELLDIGIALHLGDPLAPVVELHNLGPTALLPSGCINPGLWAYEGKVQGSPERFITPRGSNNHKLVATLLDVLAGLARRPPSGATVRNERRVWLADWYAAMRDVGHDGSEFLSTTYGGTHSIIAMICADLGIPGAAEHLQRQVALYALHLTSDKRLVMPGCRSVADETPELTEWARWMLGEDNPERRRKGGGRVKAGRELVLARRLSARRFVTVGAMHATLRAVRSAVGTLVHRLHARGFVSYFETGPLCYAWPIAAVVAVDGQEPVIVRAPTSGNGKGAGEVTSAVGGMNSAPLLETRWPGSQRFVELAPLGPLVREVRIERTRVPAVGENVKEGK